ncbi:exonuclease domain-containing protein [Streptomyces sp. NPDC058847]|uniref:exonuclease domain-containing protein n=1 Tax=Streptomyces sp. NPDC058847 TaxID=3346649 RepID=UPI003679DD76
MPPYGAGTDRHAAGGGHGGLLNVIGIEATCRQGQPPPGAVSEVVEIGLAVVDLVARERVERHRIVVRPARSRVSAFCTELTGVTQAEADAGMSFADACDALVREHGAAVRPWASWGDYDRHQFVRQCAGDEVPYPFGRPAERTHTNAKAVFTATAVRQYVKLLNRNEHGATHGNPCPVTVP